MHHSGTKETPPEEEILSSLLHRSAALLPGLIRDKSPEMKPAFLHLMIFAGQPQTQVSSCYLDDFMLHDRVQPFDERLHGGVLSQQLLQLLEDSDGVIWKQERRGQRSRSESDWFSLG